MVEKVSFLLRALRGSNKLVLLPVVVLGMPLFTWSSVEVTSVPAACGSCHELESVVASWQRSEHAPKDGRDRADCRACHIPSWSHPLDAVYGKLRHAAVDLSAKVAQDPDDEFYFRLKYQTLAATGNESCLRCHEAILTPDHITKNEDGDIRGLHLTEEAKKLSCVTCHRGTGHGPYE